MKLLLYLTLIFFIVSCNSAKKNSASSLKDTSKVIINYSCGACFGKCPIYKVEINGNDNTITFIGEKDTDKIGTYIKSVPKLELIELINAFERAQFTSMNDEYLGIISDFPIRYISYKSQKETKTIKFRSNEPEQLSLLEKMLTTIADSKEGWKKIENLDH